MEHQLATPKKMCRCRPGCIGVIQESERRKMKQIEWLRATGQPTCFACLMSLFLCLFISAFPAEAREIKVGAYENHPKVFTQEDGTVAGIFPDIIEEVARREGWTVTYVHGSWTESLSRLKTGEIDLMVDIAYSPERERIFMFCEDDVICNWAQIYTQPGMGIEVITELDGLKLAGLRNGIHLKRFEELARQFGIEYEMTLCDDYSKIFSQIDKKMVDAGIVNRIYGYSDQDKYAVERSPIIFSPASLRFDDKKGHEC